MLPTRHANWMTPLKNVWSENLPHHHALPLEMPPLQMFAAGGIAALGWRSVPTPGS